MNIFLFFLGMLLAVVGLAVITAFATIAANRLLDSDNNIRWWVYVIAAPLLLPFLVVLAPIWLIVKYGEEYK